MQTKPKTTHRNATAALRVIVLMLGCSLAAKSQTTAGNPMCATFVGDTTYLGSDGGGDRKQMYCDQAQPDVLCGSNGKGFILTTAYASPSRRKAWIDLRSAVQYNYPPVPAKSLPRGEVEMELRWMVPNHPDGSCIPDAIGAPLTMVPGGYYFAALRIRLTEGKNWYDLRFGQPFCWETSSGCPVSVTAGDDFDGDGFADIWTIEPAQPDATAILFKGKSNPDAPVSVVIGFFQVPFTLVFTKAEFSAVLSQFN